LATRGLAVAAGVRGTRQHAVLGRHPALALAAQPAADAVLDTGGAQHLGVAETDQHRAFAMAGEVALDADRAQLARGATTGRVEAVANRCCHATSTGEGAREYTTRGPPAPRDPRMIRSITAHASGERETPCGTLSCELR